MLKWSHRLKISRKSHVLGRRALSMLAAVPTTATAFAVTVTVSASVLVIVVSGHLRNSAARGSDQLT